MTSPTPLLDRWSSVSQVEGHVVPLPRDRLRPRPGRGPARVVVPLRQPADRRDQPLRPAQEGQAAAAGPRPADLAAVQPGERGVGLPGLARRAPPHGQPHPRRHRRQRRRPAGPGVRPRQVGPEHHGPPRRLPLHQVHRPVPAVPPRADHPAAGRRLGPDDRGRARRVRPGRRPAASPRSSTWGSSRTRRRSCSAPAAASGPSSDLASPEEEEAVAAYALDLGKTFQIVDDLLDFTGDARVLGKPVLSDLGEGRITLPLIHALKKADRPGRARLKALVGRKDISAAERRELLARLEGTRGLRSRPATGPRVHREGARTDRRLPRFAAPRDAHPPGGLRTDRGTAEGEEAGHDRDRGQDQDRRPQGHAGEAPRPRRRRQPGRAPREERPLRLRLGRPARRAPGPAPADGGKAGHPDLQGRAAEVPVVQGPGGVRDPGPRSPGDAPHPQGPGAQGGLSPTESTGPSCGRAA
ncbi:MAG: polyprenyl synthetase family protein [Candidatus Moduliflexus flocculans]|nr:polyprenyl synthetase family protein [Candidatus Moduliflexus flocculans]